MPPQQADAKSRHFRSLVLKHTARKSAWMSVPSSQACSSIAPAFPLSDTDVALLREDDNHLPGMRRLTAIGGAGSLSAIVSSSPRASALAGAWLANAQGEGARGHLAPFPGAERERDLRVANARLGRGPHGAVEDAPSAELVEHVAFPDRWAAGPRRGKLHVGDGARPFGEEALPPGLVRGAEHDMAAALRVLVADRDSQVQGGAGPGRDEAGGALPDQGPEKVGGDFFGANDRQGGVEVG